MRTFVFLFLLTARAPAAGPASFHVDYTTYLGGSLDDQPAGIVVDSAGNAYLVGTTSSSDFPFTSYDFFVPYQERLLPTHRIQRLRIETSGRSMRH